MTMMMTIIMPLPGADMKMMTMRLVIPHGVAGTKITIIIPPGRLARPQGRPARHQQMASSHSSCVVSSVTAQLVTEDPWLVISRSSVTVTTAQRRALARLRWKVAVTYIKKVIKSRALWAHLGTLLAQPALQDLTQHLERKRGVLRHKITKR